jgi:oligopeptide transport system substrate-binding protein
VSYIDNIPQEERNALEAEGLYILVPVLGTYYVSFNTQKAPFDNPLLRKALTLAIDNDFIANVLRQGAVIPAEAFVGNGFYTSGHDVEFRAEGLKYIDSQNYEQRKEEAREALAEAGYPNGEGLDRIEYLLNEMAMHTMIAEAIQHMWKEVLNVNMEIRTAEWSVVQVDRRQGNFQIARNGWIADFNDPMTMLGLLVSSSQNNDGKYSNPVFDAKIEESMNESDPAKRSLLLHEAEDIMMDDWACAPIYFYCDEKAADPKMQGRAHSMVGYTFFHKAYLGE